MKKYNEFEWFDGTLTKEVLDSIKVGDRVKCNGWKKPMKITAVSENYFIMTQNLFGRVYYSICEKLPSKITCNHYNEGMFRIGADNYYGYYDYDNKEECEEALIRLEDGYNYTSLAEENKHPNYYDWKKTANPITLEKGHMKLSRKAVNLTYIAIRSGEQ